VLKRGSAALGAALVIAFGAAQRASADATPEESLIVLDRKLEAFPTDASLWQQRATLERLRGGFARAHADLGRARELGLPPALAERDEGSLWLVEGRPAEAVLVLGRARAHAPEDVSILLPYARALAAMGRWRESADVYAEVVRLAPDANPDVHLERTRVLAAGGGATRDEALRALDQACARLGPVPALDQAALALELESGRTDAALARVARMAGATSRPERFLVQRAEILERAGRHDAAASAYGAALASLESLPAARRATRAVEEIEDLSRSGIARIAAQTQPDRR